MNKPLAYAALVAAERIPLCELAASGPAPRVDQPALSVGDLSFRYGRKVALDTVSFAIMPGEPVILLGPNGAGKTTLFALICGLFNPPSGAISIGGQSLRDIGPAALEELGIVFQAQTLDLDLTVRQNLRYFCALRGLRRDLADERIHRELSRLDMADCLDDKVRTLNGGHRRRIEIARAVLHEPKLLLLDEPTVGLDIPTRRALVRHLHRMGKEDRRALFWATHLIDEVEETDRVIVLDRGRVVADGKPGQLIAETGAQDLAQAYALLTGPQEDA